MFLSIHRVGEKTKELTAEALPVKLRSRNEHASIGKESRLSELSVSDSEVTHALNQNSNKGDVATLDLPSRGVAIPT